MNQNRYVIRFISVFFSYFFKNNKLRIEKSIHNGSIIISPQKLWRLIAISNPFEIQSRTDETIKLNSQSCIHYVL